MMYQITILVNNTGYFKNLYVCTHLSTIVKYYEVPHRYITFISQKEGAHCQGNTSKIFLSGRAAAMGDTYSNSQR